MAHATSRRAKGTQVQRTAQTGVARARRRFLTIDRRRSKLVAYTLLAPPPHFFGYVVAPLAVSRRGRRHGWRGGRPSKRNLVGLLPLAAGAGLIAWAAVSHYSESPPDRIQTSPVPEYLVTGGAYTL